MKEFKRTCPICGKEKIYKKRYYLERAIENNSNCKSCAISKNNKGKKRKSFSKKHKDRISKAVSKYRKGKSYVDLYGIEKANIINKKKSKTTKGRKRKPFSQEWKNNMSKSRKSSKIYQDWMSSDEYRKKRQEIAIRSHHGISLEEWEQFSDDRKVYYNKVKNITRRQNYKSLENYDKRGDWQKDGYHLDHIYPIYKGFQNNISPEIIGHISNLKYIHWFENSSKSGKILNKEHKLFIENKMKEYE